MGLQCNAMQHSLLESGFILDALYIGGDRLLVRPGVRSRSTRCGGAARRQLLTVFTDFCLKIDSDL